MENTSDSKRPTSIVSSSRPSMDLLEYTSQHLQLKTAQPQRQRWEIFFDPQYTFTSFIHQLDEQDSEYLKREHQKNLDHLVDISHFGAQTSDVVMSNPSSYWASPTEERSELTWVEPKEDLLVVRLEILKQIRASLHREQRDMPTHLVGRLKQALAMKAHKFRQEAGVADDLASKASTVSQIEEMIEEEEVKKGTNGCRRSFLLFLFGFIFPPLWLVGGIYFDSYEKHQTSANRRLDRKWRRRSRVSFGVFTIALLIVFVTLFVINPSSIGFRRST